MPLVLHPPSCCDICMEDYSCDELARFPYAIDCGHIFCRTCVRGFTPKTCPLCRASFIKGRRLHVDASNSGKRDRASVTDTHASLLLERIALASDETTSAEEVLAVIADVSDWISTRSDGDTPNSYKPLRLALDALCRYRSSLSSSDDLETLRAMERSMRMQLDEERGAASLRHNKLQAVLKAVSSDLQAERARFITELLAEKEASAKTQQKYRNILQEAAANIQRLQTENKSLLSKLETIPGKETLTIPTTHSSTHLETELPRLYSPPSPFSDRLNLPSHLSTSIYPQPPPYIHPCRRNEDNPRDDFAVTTAGTPSIHASSITRNPFIQTNALSHCQPGGSSGSSSLEDIIRQSERRNTSIPDESTELPQGLAPNQCSYLDSHTLSIPQDGSTTATVLLFPPERSRRLLKVSSSPSIRINGDRCSSGDRRGAGIKLSAYQAMPVPRIFPCEPVNSKKEATPSITKQHRHTHQWLHPWRIFKS